MIEFPREKFPVRADCRCVALNDKEILIFGGIAETEEGGYSKLKGIFTLNIESKRIKKVQDDSRGKFEFYTDSHTEQQVGKNKVLAFTRADESFDRLNFIEYCKNDTDFKIVGRINL